MDARYYSSSLGRWLSADWSAVPAPVPYANLTNPQTLNLYAMVRDNPETFADLDGHADGQDAVGAHQHISDDENNDTAKNASQVKPPPPPPPPPPPSTSQNSSNGGSSGQQTNKPSAALAPGALAPGANPAAQAAKALAEGRAKITQQVLKEVPDTVNRTEEVIKATQNTKLARVTRLIGKLGEAAELAQHGYISLIVVVNIKESRDLYQRATGQDLIQDGTIY